MIRKIINSLIDGICFLLWTLLVLEILEGFGLI